LKNEKSISTWATVSLVCSIVGLFAFGLILGIVAIIAGSYAWERGTAKAGVIIGIIDVVLLLLFFL
jgi:hypothetical protein